MMHFQFLIWENVCPTEPADESAERRSNGKQSLLPTVFQTGPGT